MKSLKTLILTVIVLTAALLTSPALGRDFSWDGNFDELWDRNSGPPNRRTNWDPQGMSGPIPNADDNVFFGNIAAERFTVDLDGDHTVLSATFSGSDDYTLIGSVSTDTLTLVTGDITASGAATHEISAGDRKSVV